VHLLARYSPAYASNQYRGLRSVGPQRLARAQITAIVTTLRDIGTVLRNADPADKAEIYGQLGLSLIYHPAGKLVTAKVRPAQGMELSQCPRPDTVLSSIPRFALTTGFLVGRDGR
jgi:hypothetical protein